MQLTQANLEKCGWLFSPSLRLMVREHELGNGKWDVELDSYRNMSTEDDPRWENDQKVFDAADTLAELIARDGNIAVVRDWVHGDKVEFF
jgi:hypothetical protein